MQNKILSIREKVPQSATLPDGYYTGTWCGSTIEVQHKGKTYELETNSPISCFGFKVVIEVKEGVATFALSN